MPFFGPGLDIGLPASGDQWNGASGDVEKCVSSPLAVLGTAGTARVLSTESSLKHLDISVRYCT